MSLFSFSKKPVSPRPNIAEEKEDAHHDRKRAGSSNKKKGGKTGNELLVPSLSEDPDRDSSSDDERDTGISVSATKGFDAEAEEEADVEEHVEEDKKPFDAATSLLIFHDGQVYVREDRSVTVENNGQAVIRDLPASIHPASLNFCSLTDPEASIVEQTLEHGTESFAALLAESVGEVVTLRLPGKSGSVKGKLLRTTTEKEDVVLETEEGSVVVISRSHVAGVEVNHWLNKEPSLHCVVETSLEGAHKAQLTYEASGINWTAEYTLVVHPDLQAEFTGWITLANHSGKTFKDAALALVAAPHSAPAQYDDRESSNTNNKMKKFSVISSFGKRKSPKPVVSTQNITYMPRPTTLVHGKDKQVRITHATFSIEQANLFRPFVGAYKGAFQGSQSDHTKNQSVEMILRWTNSKATHHRLGIELTSGNVDVLDSAKGDTFLNLRHQALLNFTRPGEEILLVTGRHTDLVGERRVTELKFDPKTRTLRESVQIELKNTGKAKQEVVVEDLLWRYHNYTVSPCQPKYDNIIKGKQIMTWRIVVAPKVTEIIRYSVLYSNLPV